MMTTIELFVVSLRVGQVTFFESSPSVSIRKSDRRGWLYSHTPPRMNGSRIASDATDDAAAASPRSVTDTTSRGSSAGE